MKRYDDLKRELDSGAGADLLRKLYRSATGGEETAAGRYHALMDTFVRRFGAPDRAALFSTPGRTEIGGNHTDHQHGCVLAGSVNLDVIAMAAPNGLDVVRMESEGYPGQEIPLGHLAPNPEEYNDSRALVKGVVARFREKGHKVGGFDVCLTSTVLKGSGLSSSAAFEIMMGTIVSHLFAGGTATPVELAIVGRYAENVFFGKPCGLMDQIACSVGGVAFIDFKNIDNPVIQKVEFDFLGHGYALCIIDSGADHSCMTDEYSPIPREMGQVAEYFGKVYLREVSRDEFMLALPAVRRYAGDRAVLRAMHFFNDNARVPLQAKALREDRIDEFLSLVNASGRSSVEYLQNVYPSGATHEQAVGLALALCDEFLRGKGAYRVHGGGFAGTVQAFVPLDMLDGFKEKMEAVLGNGRCHVLSIRNAGSIRLL